MPEPSGAVLDQAAPAVVETQSEPAPSQARGGRDDRGRFAAASLDARAAESVGESAESTPETPIDPLAPFSEQLAALKAAPKDALRTWLKANRDHPLFEVADLEANARASQTVQKAKDEAAAKEAQLAEYRRQQEYDRDLELSQPSNPDWEARDAASARLLTSQYAQRQAAKAKELALGDTQLQELSRLRAHGELAQQARTAAPFKGISDSAWEKIEQEPTYDAYLTAAIKAAGWISPDEHKTKVEAALAKQHGRIMNGLPDPDLVRGERGGADDNTLGRITALTNRGRDRGSLSEAESKELSGLMRLVRT